jgi:hypothetical protein
MQTQMKRVFPQAALERVLAALERELIEASDEEILEAAHELGMKPEMKGSAAFLGLRYPSARRAAAEFFGPEAVHRLLSERLRLLDFSSAPQIAKPESAPAPAQPRRPRRAPARGGRSARARLPKEPGES